MTQKIGTYNQTISRELAITDKGVQIESKLLLLLISKTVERFLT